MKMIPFFEKFSGESLTYDDLILLPRYVDFPVDEIDLSSQLMRNIRLNTPIISSPMDTVTEASLAIGIALQGGIGIIHYNMSPENQLKELQKVKCFTTCSDGKKYPNYPLASLDRSGSLLVGAAVETWAQKAKQRIELIKELVDVIIFDTSQGFTRFELDLIRWTKEYFPSLQVIGGNVVTGEACEALIHAGADAIRVGMGSGSICTTQQVGGIGRGQATAVYECAQICHKHGVSMIADGGITKSADIVKALVLGADQVMLGSLLAGTSEAPGEHQVKKGIRFKEYRGMGSDQAMERGSAARYGIQKSQIRVPEGVAGFVPSRGSIHEWVPHLIQGVKQGFHKLGLKNIKDFSTDRDHICLERRSQEAQREGSVHSLFELIQPIPEHRPFDEKQPAYLEAALKT